MPRVNKVLKVREMDNKEFAQQLEIRTRKFAVQAIKFSGTLPNHQEAWVIRNQLTKSASSVGANYREANRARSRADFANKIRISEGEASETVYWLEILYEIDWIAKEELKIILKEAKELLGIFTSISNKLRDNNDQK